MELSMRLARRGAILAGLFAGLVVGLGGRVCAGMGATVEAAGSAYAIYSPAMASELRGESGSAEGARFVKAAEAEMGDAPHAVARLHTEGTLEHQGIRDESVEAEKDFQKMLDFGFAYRMSGEKRYLQAEARYLSAWCRVYQPSYNPIDETRFDLVMAAFDLTRADLPGDVTAEATGFFRKMATGYVDWVEKNGKTDPYNWTSHRIKLAVLGAYESGDAALIAGSGKIFHEHVKANVRKDGSVQDFYKRDAMHYVVYDLEPLVTAAVAAKGHGEDWFHTAAGSPSLEMGMDWLTPYATGEKTHEEFVHSTVKFDADRDKAGEKGYSGRWEPRTSVTLLALAAWEDARFEPVLRQVEAATGAKAAGWATMGMRVAGRKK